LLTLDRDLQRPACRSELITKDGSFLMDAQ
jgi:hypothetical protein